MEQLIPYFPVVRSDLAHALAVVVELRAEPFHLLFHIRSVGAVADLTLVDDGLPPLFQYGLEVFIGRVNQSYYLVGALFLGVCELRYSLLEDLHDLDVRDHRSSLNVITDGH